MCVGPLRKTEKKHGIKRRPQMLGVFLSYGCAVRLMRLLSNLPVDRLCLLSKLLVDRLRLLAKSLVDRARSLSNVPADGARLFLR
jgi:hypothetical protein